MEAVISVFLVVPILAGVLAGDIGRPANCRQGAICGGIAGFIFGLTLWPIGGAIYGLIFGALGGALRVRIFGPHFHPQDWTRSDAPDKTKG